MSTELNVGEAFCPHCHAIIYIGFVRINGKCAACTKPVTIKQLVFDPMPATDQDGRVDEAAK